jgi:hypothetical protein
MAGFDFEGAAAEAVQFFHDEHFSPVCERDEDCADRLRLCAAGGAGDAGDGDGVVGVETHPCAARHFAGGGIAHGSVPCQRLSADAEQELLCPVAVGDHAAEKNSGGAGNIGQLIADMSAGAGFGEDEGLFARGEPVNDFAG